MYVWHALRSCFADMRHGLVELVYVSRRSADDVQALAHVVECREDLES